MLKPTLKLNTKRSLNAAFLLVFSLVFSAGFIGCAKEKYLAKPIEPTQITAKILAKSTQNADFKSYLIKQGYAKSELPFTSWGLDELTLSARYHHPKLNVAKAQMALAEAELQSAGNKTNPTINADIARSNRANDAVKPWSLGLKMQGLLPFLDLPPCVILGLPLIPALRCVTERRGVLFQDRGSLQLVPWSSWAGSRGSRLTRRRTA